MPSYGTMSGMVDGCCGNPGLTLCRWWYSPVLPTENSFPASCRQTLVAFLISVSSHLSRKRPADNFVDFVTRSSSFMIIFFQELSAAMGAAPFATTPDAV